MQLPANFKRRTLMQISTGALSRMGKLWLDIASFCVFASMAATAMWEYAPLPAVQGELADLYVDMWPWLG